MEKISTHKDLNIWKKSMDLVENIYRLTATFPSSEKYGIISQINRSAISIPANIAEGAARKGSKEFIQFLHISLGSLSELETLLELARRLNFCTEKELSEINDLISFVMSGTINLIRSIKNKIN